MQRDYSPAVLYDIADDLGELDQSVLLDLLVDDHGIELSCDQQSIVVGAVGDNQSESITSLWVVDAMGSDL